MKKGNIRIKITGEEGDDLLILDPIKGYEGRLDKFLLVANNMEVVNNEVFLDEVLYYHWFKPAREKVFKEISELFYSNLKLFWEKRDIILKDPRLYSIISPKSFRAGMFIGEKPITLGEILMLWERESIFSIKCDCGGKAVVYHCAGSILSGTLFSIKSICLQCDKSYDKNSFPHRFSNYICVMREYHPIKPIAERPAGIKNLVEFLQGRRTHIDDTEYDEIQYIPDDNMSITVGGKTIPNSLFASISNAINFETVTESNEDSANIDDEPAQEIIH